MSATRNMMQRLSTLPRGEVAVGIAAAIVSAFGPLVERALTRDEIVETTTVNSFLDANALLARGWKHLGVAAHQNAAPEFHLGRPAGVTADGQR